MHDFPSRVIKTVDVTLFLEMWFFFPFVVVIASFDPGDVICYRTLQSGYTHFPHFCPVPMPPLTLVTTPQPLVFFSLLSSPFPSVFALSLYLVRFSLQYLQPLVNPAVKIPLTL